MAEFPTCELVPFGAVEECLKCGAPCTTDFPFIVRYMEPTIRDSVFVPERLQMECYRCGAMVLMACKDASDG